MPNLALTRHEIDNKKCSAQWYSYHPYVDFTYILCTGGAYYVPYSFLFISKKFCNGGGAARAGWLSSFIHLLLHPPQYGPWNLPCGLLVHKITYAPVIFGPQMALAYRLNAISQGRKNSQFSGPNPNPFPLAHVMDMHASKTHARGCINHKCVNSYSNLLRQVVVRNTDHIV
jgi:hypothetical protein